MLPQLNEKLLQIEDLTKVFTLRRGFSSIKFLAVDKAKFAIEAATPEIFALVGESGSGKTTLANVVMGFTGLTSGQIIFKGKDTSQMNRAEKIDYRRQVQAVFQDPYAVYNPFYRVKHIFDMAISNFKMASSKAAARDMIEKALNIVGMRGAEVLEKYPHQLSGGQRQRMMMARAYMLKPSLIVADEPVSMVDASLRAMILDIMLRLRDEENIAFLYITHDLSTAYQVGDELFLLYQGSVAESGRTVKVIDNPKHPYAQALLGSIPVPDPTQKWAEDIILPDDEEQRTVIESGCRFYARCPRRMDKCLIKQPPLYLIEQEHQSACYLYENLPLADKAVALA